MVHRPIIVFVLKRIKLPLPESPISGSDTRHQFLVMPDETFIGKDTLFSSIYQHQRIKNRATAPNHKTKSSTINRPNGRLKQLHGNKRKTINTIKTNGIRAPIASR